jgi:hypothetical protein
MVIVKGATAVAAIFGFDNDTSYTPAFGTTSGVIDSAVTDLTTDGFKVGSDTTVNGIGATYHWMAFREESGYMKTGKYTGNGTDNRDITGLGFQPDIAITFCDSSYVYCEAYWRTSSNTSDSVSNFGSSGVSADKILGFVADGFRISDDNRVNRDNVPYRYVAFKLITGYSWTGTYTGDGNDDRSITGATAEPNLVWVGAQKSIRSRVFKTSSEDGDNSLLFSAIAESGSNVIQAFESTGFQVGTDNTVNESGTVYYWFAWKTR